MSVSSNEIQVMMYPEDIIILRETSQIYTTTKLRGRTVFQGVPDAGYSIQTSFDLLKAIKAAHDLEIPFTVRFFDITTGKEAYIQ